MPEPYVRPDPLTRWRVGDDLDWCQLFLHDEGALWSRTELLAWYRLAYTELLAAGQSVRQWRGFDLPPRHTVTITHQWESAFTWQEA